VQQSQTLNLSIGDDISDRRLSTRGWSGAVSLKGKQLFIEISENAMRAIEQSRLPIVAELELYFSCLVRKQTRFREINGVQADNNDYARVIPGFYTTFRAVTTKHCTVAETDGKPPVEAMPIQRAERFVPDWLKIDYRAGHWLGEYGFARKV
jgi:hypothetical protein